MSSCWTVLWRKVLKEFESTKLYYNKYFYRLEINNCLATHFRDKNLPKARKSLDVLQKCYDNNEELLIGWGLRSSPVSISDFVDAKKLYNIFSNYEDYKLRVERNFFNIYANDLSWLETIKRAINTNSLHAFYKPSDNAISLLDSNTIIVKKDNGYKYKVTLSTKTGNPSFAKWAQSNPKLVKVGSKLIDYMLNEEYIYGMYFYARDEKVLHLCSLMLGDIGRIDKLVVKSSI